MTAIVIVSVGGGLIAGLLTWAFGWIITRKRR